MQLSPTTPADISLTSNVRLRKAKLILATIPAGLFCLCLILIKHHGPYFLRNNFDPDYAYLLNSLSLLRFQTPGHTDHPGTTLQLLGAVVVLFKWLWTSLFVHRQALTDSVLSHPEEYLRAINIVLDVLISVALYCSAWTVYRLSNSLPAALVLQGSVFVYMQTFLALFRVSPEPLLIAAGLALMVPLAPVVLRRGSGANENMLAVAAGAIFGFGLITKVTFAPWMAAILLFPKKTQKRRFGITAAVAALVFLLPVTARFAAMSSWFTSLLTHAGHYGKGRVGIPDANVLAANLVSLWQVEPALFWFLGVYAIVLLALPIFRKQGAPLPDGVRPLLLAGCTAITAEVILVTKHPAFHYLLPALVLTAFVNSALWALLPRPSLGTLQIRQVILVPLIAVIGIGLVRNWAGFQWWMGAARTDRQNIAELHAVEERLLGCRVMGSYRSSLKVYALAFGNGSSAGVHGSALEKLYPAAINYDPFGDRFWPWSFMNGENDADADVKRLVSNGQCVLMEATPLEASTLARRAKDGIRFEALFTAANPILPSAPTTLYRLEGAGGP